MMTRCGKALAFGQFDFPDFLTFKAAQFDFPDLSEFLSLASVLGSAWSLGLCLAMAESTGNVPSNLLNNIMHCRRAGMPSSLQKLKVRTMPVIASKIRSLDE
jgi:hypothetical protein